MSLADKRALVTGANGFVGSYVCRHLAELGVSVRALVRRAGEAEDLAADGIEEMEGNFVEVETAIRAVEGMDYVVHCAATVGPDLETARPVNVDGTRAIFEAVRSASPSPRAVHISSVSVYCTKDGEEVDESGTLLDEGGGHVYGVTKAEGDRVVLDAIEAGAHAVILRPGAVLGVHPTSTWGTRMPQRIRDREIKLCDGGTGSLPIVHVDDLCRAVVLALTRDAAAGHVYNVVDDHVTWRTYVDDVREWFGTEPLESVGVGEGGVGERNTKFHAERIREDLGYEPTKSYADGMAEARRWWEERGAGV